MKPFSSLCLAVLLALALVCVSFLAPPIAVGQSGPKGTGDHFPVPYLRGSADSKQYMLQGQSVQLAHQLAKAENDDEKKELRKKLTRVLEQQFDAQLKEQQKELDDLEKQVARLKKLLSKRREAKETIVERRLEQLVQDAEGLGWNAPNTPRGSIPYLGAPNVSVMERKDALFPFAGKGDGGAKK